MGTAGPETPAGNGEWKHLPDGFHINKPLKVLFRKINFRTGEPVDDVNDKERVCYLMRSLIRGKAYKLGLYQDDPTQDVERVIGAIDDVVISQSGKVLRTISKSSCSMYELEIQEEDPPEFQE